MEGRFVREDNNDYMEFCPDIDSDIPRYTTGMLENNRISGILEMQTKSINNRTAYYFDISGMVPMDEFMSTKKCETDVILDLLKCLDRTLAALDEYFLDRDGIILKPQHIMWKPQERKAYFAYLPGEGDTLNAKMQHLFEYYMEHMAYTKREDTIRFYEAYQCILGGDASVMKLYDIIQGSGGKEYDNGSADEYNGGIADGDDCDVTVMSAERNNEESGTNTVLRANTGLRTKPLLIKGVAAVICVLLILSQVFTSQFPVRIPMPLAIVLMAIPAAMFTRVSRSGKGQENTGIRQINTADTCTADIYESDTHAAGSAAYAQAAGNIPDTAREDIYATRKLCERNAECGTAIVELWHDDNPEDGRLIINKVPCIIGRRGMEADIFIEDEYISRMHAQISVEDEAVVVRDLYSGNGTYVNGKKLIPNEPVRLVNGDVITFAAALYRVVNSNPI